jgi:hypothetical protein
LPFSKADNLVLERLQLFHALHLAAIEPGYVCLNLGGDDLSLVLMAALSRRDLDSCRSNRIDLHLMLSLLNQSGFESRPLFEIDSTVTEPLGLRVEPLKFEE